MNAADRKQQLIAEGALHRIEAMRARESVRASLRPGMLAKGALQAMATTALAAYVGTGAGAGLAAKLPMLLSLATRAWSIVAGRKGVRTTAVRLAAVGAAVGAFYVYLKRKPH